MDCATHAGIAAMSTCTRCQRPVCGVCRETLDGSDYCASCVAELKAKLAAPPTAEAGPAISAPGFEPIAAAPGFPVMGVLLGASAGLVGALAWYGFVALTDFKLGLVAVGVGWLVGWGSVKGAGGGGMQLAVLSVIIAVASMALGEYLIVNHAVHTYFAKERPDEVLPALIAPARLLPIYTSSFGIMDIVFYAIGAWEAFRIPSKAATRG